MNTIELSKQLLNAGEVVSQGEITETQVLSEKLAKLYGVDAWTKIITSCSTYGGENYKQLYLAEDSGRISDLADENGVSVVLGRDSANAFDENMIKYDFYEKYSDHPSKSAAARMARVKCLIVIGEAR